MSTEQTQNQVQLKHHHVRYGLVVFVFVVVLLSGALAYAYMKITELEDRAAILSANLASTTVALATLNSETTNISQTLSSTKEDVAAVHTNLANVQNQVGGVAQQVGSMSGTVSTLEKLSTIDPELLKKYSKVYFLNENYTPAHLAQIPQADIYSNTKQEQYLTEALPFLQRLLDASKVAGVTLYIDSAYRSFARQQTLKGGYVVTYGAGTANSFSAEQGYSEHQLGTAIDFITSGFGGQLTTSFEKTKEYIWLSQHAYEYGFVLSYPKGNTYYQYEPWHWRFVGVKLATYLHNTNEHFYDVDQRDIDSYLAALFDAS